MRSHKSSFANFAGFHFANFAFTFRFKRKVHAKAAKKDALPQSVAASPPEVMA
ncbi:MAG: hypothetical protein K1X52_13455 [Pyrinomonadaceae bacterium]|nr:hypothetical protein [Pyrinomonadaceae bacterium]